MSAVTHIVHYSMFVGEPELLSIVDSAWSDKALALRRVAWIVAQGGEASIATRYVDDSDLELRDHDDTILVKRQPPRRQPEEASMTTRDDVIEKKARARMVSAKLSFAEKIAVLERMKAAVEEMRRPPPP